VYVPVYVPIFPGKFQKNVRFFQGNFQINLTFPGKNVDDIFKSFTEKSTTIKK